MNLLPRDLYPCIYDFLEFSDLVNSIHESVDQNYMQKRLDQDFLFLNPKQKNIVLQSLSDISASQIYTLFTKINLDGDEYSLEYGLGEIANFMARNLSNQQLFDSLDNLISLAREEDCEGFLKDTFIIMGEEVSKKYIDHVTDLSVLTYLLIALTNVKDQTLANNLIGYIADNYRSDIQSLFVTLINVARTGYKRDYN